MAAAAVAAWLGLALVGEPAGWAAGALVWLLALAGGAVEGLAVGGLQRHVLLPFLPSLSVRRFVGATVLVAVAGWALGMAFPAFVSWQVEPASPLFRIESASSMFNRWPESTRVAKACQSFAPGEGELSFAEISVGQACSSMVRRAPAMYD